MRAIVLVVLVIVVATVVQEADCHGRGRGRGRGQKPYYHRKHGSHSPHGTDTKSTPGPDCGSPQTPENGNVIDTKYKDVKVVKYSCREGYVMEGADTSTCQVDGTWGNVGTTCKPPKTVVATVVQEADCHGRGRGQKPYYHRKHGSHSPHGTDTKSTPGPDCGSPQTPENGNVIDTKYKDVKVVKYSCREGYVMEGADTSTCQVDGTWGNVGTTCKPPKTAKDCSDVKHEHDTAPDGVYEVQSPDSGEKLKVYCDMTTDGGGWTVLQKRFDGTTDFFRTFNEYENGFGDTNAEFWMGLKHIHEMTSRYTTELRFDVTADDNTTAYETYQNFSLSPGPDYTLYVGKRVATIDETNGLAYNNGSRFSTKDRDVDDISSMQCADDFHGAHV